MTANSTHLAVAAASALELMVLALAGFQLARSRGLTFAEAAAYALMGSLMTVSALIQAGLLFGLPTLFAVAEAAAVAGAAWSLFRHRARLAGIEKAVASPFGANRGVFWAVGATLCYLAAQAACLPPLYTDQALLARLAPLWSGHGPLAACDPARNKLFPLGPLNAAVLPWMILRFGTDTGVGLFGFIAYLSLGAATYALARRYAWPPTALTAALIIWSLPRFVFNATSAGLEIVPAAAGLVAVLALYRLVESPNGTDLAVLSCAIGFAISDGPLCLVFPGVLAALSAVLLFRRHGLSYWIAMAGRHRCGALLLLSAVLLFFQVPAFSTNLAAGAPWVGQWYAPPFAHNGDGIMGAAANGLRYLLQTFHLPLPCDRLWEAVFGSGLALRVEQIHDIILGPLLGQRGTRIPFAVLWAPESGQAWFGPLGALLALPALAYAGICAPRRLKALAVALLGYGYLVSLIAAWQPGNARFFSPLFACTGFVIAFFLPPWRLTRTGKGLLQVVSTVLLIYAAAGYAERPLIGWHPLSDAAQNLLKGDVKSGGQCLKKALRASAWAKGRFQGIGSRPKPGAGKAAGEKRACQF